METWLDFELPIVNLEKRLTDLRELSKQENVELGEEIALLERKRDRLIDDVFSKLSPWQRVQLSRHPNRPYTQDYLQALFPDFMELHGDRAYGEDQAIVGGIALWPPAVGTGTGNANSKASKVAASERFPVLILGHQKGRTTKQKIERNFGMAKPEGYRKAIRLMKMADRARMPILTFIDTPGAYPGIDAEERGQSQAIAEAIETMFELTVPILSVVIGEGGSGGALAIAVADKVLMQENSIYSVISPESCASILWNNSGLAERASEKLKISATELHRFKVIDGIVPEPRGGAHRNWDAAGRLLAEALVSEFTPMLTAFAADRKAGVKSRGYAALSRAPKAAASTKLKKAPKLLKGKAQARTTGTLGNTGLPVPGLSPRAEKFRAMGNFAIATAQLSSGADS